LEIDGVVKHGMLSCKFEGREGCLCSGRFGNIVEAVFFFFLIIFQVDYRGCYVPFPLWLAQNFFF